MRAQFFFITSLPASQLVIPILPLKQLLAHV